MDRHRLTLVMTLVSFALPGCVREERGPLLAGGRELKSWLADLHDARPHVRRQAVLKLGNVGDADPAAAAGLAGALRDSDALVRRDAIQAVAKLSRPGQIILDQLKAMRDNDRDPQVRDRARKAITHFGVAD